MTFIRRHVKALVIVALLASAAAVIVVQQARSHVSDTDKREISAAIERYAAARALATEWPLSCAREMRLPADAGGRIQHQYETQLRAATTPRLFNAERTANVAGLLNRWRRGDEFYMIIDYRHEVLDLKVTTGLRLDGKVVVEVSEQGSEKVFPTETRNGAVVPEGPIDAKRAKWRTYPPLNYRYTLERVDGEWKVDDMEQLPPFG
jgi:hypothetical protein